MKTVPTSFDFTRTDMIFKCPNCGITHIIEGFDDYSDGMEQGRECECGTYLIVTCKQPNSCERNVETEQDGDFIIKTTIIKETTARERKYFLSATRLGTRELICSGWLPSPRSPHPREGARAI